MEPPQENRQEYWRRILEWGTGPWWMKAVVVNNPGGPAILAAYKPEDKG
jgi:hypothetical protein